MDVQISQKEHRHRDRDQGADAGSVRGAFRFISRSLVKTPFYAQMVGSSTAANPIRYLTALKLHRQIKRASKTIDNNTPKPTLRSQFSHLLISIKKYGLIITTAMPGFVKSFYMGRFLFQTYGKLSTAQNYIAPSGISYDKKKYTLIHQLNFSDAFQQA